MSPAVVHLLPDTTVPGFTTRRVWRDSELTSHSLVLLTVSRLYLTTQPIELTAVQTQKLLVGGQPEILLGPGFERFELADLTEAEHDLDRQEILLTFADSTTRLVRFKQASTADDFYSKLARRVQDRFQVIAPRTDVLQAMRAPLAAMFGVLTVMIGLMLTANAYKDLSEFRFLTGTTELPTWYFLVEQFFSVLPPPFIGSLSGCLLAVLQLWAYRRLTTPPAKLSLETRQTVDVTSSLSRESRC